MGFLERAPSLTDRAADEIRARIVQGVFRLGEPLSEITLANDLGVSKTPVREALLELKRQGLVEVHPQRGTFVFDMNAKDVDKLSEQRAILEIAALRLALAHNSAKLHARWEEIVGDMGVALQANDAVRYRTLDGDFHLAMFVLSDNPFLLEAYKLIAFRVQALRNRLSLELGAQQEVVQGPCRTDRHGGSRHEKADGRSDAEPHRIDPRALSQRAGGCRSSGRAGKNAAAL